MSESNIAHLARRFFTSLSRQPPPAADEAWAASFLSAGEVSLWKQMSNSDRRHSIAVARRFAAAMPAASREAMVAALLHDVGKCRSGLGTVSRVAATIVGPHTKRFRIYHDHERLGAEMLREVGSSEAIAGLVDGTSTDRDVLAALTAADDI